MLRLTRRYHQGLIGAHLVHEYGNNYFHAVSEVLPRLLAAEEIRLDPEHSAIDSDSALHPTLNS